MAGAVDDRFSPCVVGLLKKDLVKSVYHKCGIVSGHERHVDGNALLNRFHLMPHAGRKIQNIAVS